jgi:hypothetical protein
MNEPTMSPQADLHRAVQATIASKRIGQPVFVRYLLQGLDQADAILARLVQAAGTVRDWLGQPLERVYATGAAATGQFALTLEFRDGATGLVGYSRGQPRGSGLDLLVVGNHGAVYHDAGSWHLWEEAAPAPPDPPDPRIRTAIERSLLSGRPEPVAPEAKP